MRGFLGVVAALAAAAAVGDDVLYRLGGAEPISIGATSRATTVDLSIGAEWNTNLTCGEFDVSTSIGNQLNGVTGAFQSVMGNVINTAQGVVASLPALVIQRLNPGLYDLLQNGILEAGQEFRVAQLRCETVTEKAGETVASEGWSGIARAQHWREQIGLGTVTDPLEVDDDDGLATGVGWIGGADAGTAAEPIDVGGDVSAAGLNQLSGRAPDAMGPITCATGDVICEEWGDPDDLREWMERVVGKVEIRTCEAPCAKVVSSAGSGLQSEVVRVRQGYWNVLEPLLVTRPFPVPTQAQMDALDVGGYRVSRDMISAIRAERVPEAVGRRVAAELAVARVLDQASLARRALLAGAKEPAVANNELALNAVRAFVAELDGDIRQVEFELRVKSRLAGGTPAILVTRNVARTGVPAVEAEPGARMREGALQ